MEFGQVGPQGGSSSTAEDRDNDIPLSLEFVANTGTGVVQALDAASDSDSDGLLNSVEVTQGTDPLNPDTDGDTLSDGDEVNTHLTDPLDTDSDDDGLTDGAEVALGTDPNDPDHDADGICDGGGTGGGACTPGPDNCPFISNAGQTNSDPLSAGDACQCGDVDDDGVVTAADLLSARENLVGATPSGPGPFVPGRCNVIGPHDGGFNDCGVDDVFILDRVINAGGFLPPAAGNACAAYVGP